MTRFPLDGLCGVRLPVTFGSGGLTLRKKKPIPHLIIVGVHPYWNKKRNQEGLLIGIRVSI